MAVAALVAWLAPGVLKQAPPPEPAALVVTLVTLEPEPDPPPAAPADPPPAPSDPSADRPAAAPPPRFEVVTAPSAAPLETPYPLEVLASPDSVLAGPPLPEAVRAALRGLHDCTAAARVERGGSACRDEYRLAQAGPDAAAYLDETALRPTGVAATWDSVTKTISSMVVDDSIFDGRGGRPMVGESWWSIYAKADPLAGDWRIFDPATGEVGIAQPATAP